MKSRLFLRVRRRLLLSASSLVLAALSGPIALAQTDNPASAPPAAATPQPSASPSTPETPPPAPQPNSAPAPEQSPAAAPQASQSGGNVLPETRVAAPVERPRPRAKPPQVVSNRPPAPTAAQVLAKQTETFDAARKSLYAPTGTSPYEITQQSIEAQPARRERAARQDPAASPWRHPGFRVQRRTACAQ